MGRLTVRRDKVAWMDRLRAYTLVVDGEERGKLKQGETIEIELAPGLHHVRMQIDWAKSPVVTVRGEEDSTLRCVAAAHPLLALLYITIWSDRYITLERA
jgi:hypothetical protein